MRTIEKGLSVERLRELLSYNPETGDLTWNVARGSVKVGTTAGTRSKFGYIAIGIDRKYHKAHRLAWALMHNEWPQFQVDHRNNIRHDNRLNNLRLATPSQNQWNKRPNPNSASGLKGVSFRSDGSYSAQIYLNNRQIWLGRFATPELAHAAYARAAGEIFGAFAKTE